MFLCLPCLLTLSKVLNKQTSSIYISLSTKRLAIPNSIKPIPMKRKVVVEVYSMNGQKSRSKAMKIVVGVSGVESISLKGEEKNQIEVIGDDIDAVVITKSLRKKLGPTEIVTVAPMEEKEKEKEKEKETKKEKVKENNIVQLPLGWSSSTNPYGASVGYYSVQQLDDYDPAPAYCSIM